MTLSCCDAADQEFRAGSLDAVLTDPPYFGNIQYAELMDFCFSWLRGLVGPIQEGFSRSSTRSANELTVNATQGKDLIHFTEGLSRVFANGARALKEGAPLVFTYHHNRLEAYKSVGVAVLDSGFVCSATLPCPAEMGGSIHIHGTGSSIIDTVFVCRSTGAVQRHHLFETPGQLSTILQCEMAQLKAAGVKVSTGDLRCMAYGHMTRMAIWNLRRVWSASANTKEKIQQFTDELNRFGYYEGVLAALAKSPQSIMDPPTHPHAPPILDAANAVSV